MIDKQFEYYIKINNEMFLYTVTEIAGTKNEDDLKIILIINNL